MIRVAALALGLGVAVPAAAQEAVSEASGGRLRVLDKVSGQVEDIDLKNGTGIRVGRIAVELHDCRYPQGDAKGNAYAFVVIRDAGQETPVFSGWMIAKAPALSALDHPRYDVWVLNCATS